MDRGIQPRTAIGRRYRTVVLSVAVGLLAAPALAACSSDDSSNSSKARALTTADASLLADALFSNYDHGGASFRIVVQVGAAKTITMEGQVDWKGHAGHATVVGQGTEQGVREVYWNETTVLERRDDLDVILAETGRGAIRFVARPVDTTRYLDEVIGTVAGLASEQRDNPQLIQQNEDSEFVREDILRDVPTNVLRYGALTTYWLAKDDGRMLRLEGNNSLGTRPLVCEILTLGPQTIQGPRVDEVVDVADIQAIYDGFVAVDG